MDSYTKDNSTYIVYKRQDLPPNDRFFECKVEGEIQEAESNGITSKAPLVTDGQFRKYRLALAATGEYTAYYGGTAVSYTHLDVYKRQVLATTPLSSRCCQ